MVALFALAAVVALVVVGFTVAYHTGSILLAGYVGHLIGTVLTSLIE